jgi:acetyl-CoA carboxylase biotin carboxylase subunit
MEFRINAEDPVTYTPSAGKINLVHFPLGKDVRIDSHIYSGYTIPSFYDSLIAKLIIKGQTREDCIKTAKRCLEEFTIEGIKTNIPLLHRIVHHPDFEQAKLHTGFIEEMDA